MPTMHLPCDLTDGEKLTVGSELTAVLGLLEETKATKKNANADWNKDIKSHEKKVHELKEALRTGRVTREVDCDDEFDYDAGVVKVRRRDNGEYVTTRPIDPDERQLKLGKTGPVVSDKAVEEDKAKADEQRDAGTPEEAEAMREARLRVERRERACEALQEILAAAIALPNEADGFTAAVAANPPIWPEIVEASGDNEEEARNTLREKLVDILLAWEDGQKNARTERIMAKLGELLPKVVIASVFDGAVNLTGYRATIDGGTWTMEAEGDNQEAAAAALRVKLIDKLTADEAEIEALTASQAADAAKDKPRRGLKKPAKGPKARTHKTSGGNGSAESGEDPSASNDPEAPASGEQPLAF